MMDEDIKQRVWEGDTVATATSFEVAMTLGEYTHTHTRTHQTWGDCLLYVISYDYDYFIFMITIMVLITVKLGVIAYDYNYML